MQLHCPIRLASIVFSLYFLTADVAQATRHRTNAAKGDYGATPTDEIAQALPTSGFTIDPGAGIEVFNSAGNQELFAIESSVRCVTQASNCGTANTFYAYFYFVTIKSTAPITTPFQITIPGPFDLHNNPNLAFGIVGVIDTSGNNNPVSAIAACTNSDPTTQTNCIDSVIGNASGVTPAGITFEIDPTGLTNASSKQLAANDFLILFVTSFNPPPGCNIDVFPLPSSLHSLSPCAGQSNASPALVTSPSSTTPLSPTSFPVFGPGPLSAGRRMNTLSGYFAQQFGSLQTQANVTIQSGSTPILTISPAVQAIGAGTGPPNNVSYVYTYGITLNAAFSETITITLSGPYNETNSAALHFGLIQNQDLAGNATNVQSCSSAANVSGCLEAILNTTGLPTSNPLQFALYGNQLTVNDYIPLFATSNNAPSCTFNAAGAPGNCRASIPFTVTLGGTALTVSPTMTYGPIAAHLGDFDGDGRADIAVFRPSSGYWFIIPSSNRSTPILQQWGEQGDIPVRGDYDGDGQADVAVWRPSNGTWFVIPSSNPATAIIRPWGTLGDIPVPGDYDGDGKTDFAVFRPSNGTWYIIPSSNPGSLIVRQWGVNGDIPVPGDYDGDGETDLAIFRPSNGGWYILPSSDPSAPRFQSWGTQGDVPVPGDYDGDGRTDFAVFRPSNGVWYIIPSGNPLAPIVKQWGAIGDIPVPTEYDGITDIAVWRPSNGFWYIIPSSAPSTFTATQWGASTDVPVQKPIGQ